MVVPTELSIRDPHPLDEELDSLLFDPVDEWLVDPIDPSRPQSHLYRMLSSDGDDYKGIKLEASGVPIEEEMEKVKLEEESHEVSGVKDSSFSSLMETKETLKVELEEEKAVQEESEMMAGVKKQGESAEVKSEESSSGEEDEEEESEEEEESSEEESSSASSSSESSEESSDEEKEKVRGKDKEVEEGEIVMESDDEEEGEEGFKMSTKSSNETQALPPVPKIDAQLEQHHQTVPIGEILSILGDRVIVEGSVKHNPLNEGSILWLTHTRSPLGLVDEVFGPVKSPFYLIRYNSQEDVPSGISVGAAVSFVPEFASYVLNNNKDIYRKGYDLGDDEIDDEVEFSDDEKEAEYKRALRQAKRGSSNRNEKQARPVKGRKNVNFQKKGDGNFTSQFSHPTARPQQNQFPQNHLLPNQHLLDQLPQKQSPQNQFPQNQFLQNQFPQNQLPQNQLLQNQLLMNMSLLATGMQIPGFGLSMNTNPNPFLFGGINFPPPTMQFNPGNMQLNTVNMPSSGDRPPMQGNSFPNIHFNPVNVPFSGERPPMQFQSGNLSTGGRGSNLQWSPGSSSNGEESPTLQFNTVNSGPLQFNPGNSGGESSNMQFSPGNLSNRGRRPNQRGRGGGYFAGRTGNARPRNG